MYIESNQLSNYIAITEATCMSPIYQCPCLIEKATSLLKVHYLLKKSTCTIMYVYTKHPHAIDEVFWLRQRLNAII